VEKWLEDPSSNKGLVVEAFEYRGRNVIVMPSPSDNDGYGYQRSNHNPFIEEEQTTQWPKEKVQKDKQRSTKHTFTYIKLNNK
jgi:hypothetical protein